MLVQLTSVQHWDVCYGDSILAMCRLLQTCNPPMHIEPKEWTMLKSPGMACPPGLHPMPISTKHLSVLRNHSLIYSEPKPRTKQGPALLYLQ